MSNRLDKEREQELQPKRIDYARSCLVNKGYKIVSETSTELRFMVKNHECILFPYSGWHTGKTIKAGRGLANLLKQI